MQLFCIVCENKIKSKSKLAKYCSAACRNANWKVVNRDAYLKSAAKYRAKLEAEMCDRAVDPPPTVLCVVCDREFALSKYHPKQKCCSLKCNNKWYRIQNRAKILEQKRAEYQRNKDTYSSYNKHYKDKLRFSGNQMRALNRDGFTCQNCFEKAPKVNLIVHHIDFSGQTSKPNNKIDNLQTLCRPCHIRLHTHKL